MHNRTLTCTKKANSGPTKTLDLSLVELSAGVIQLHMLTLVRLGDSAKAGSSL